MFHLLFAQNIDIVFIKIKNTKKQGELYSFGLSCLDIKHVTMIITNGEDLFGIIELEFCLSDFAA